MKQRNIYEYKKCFCLDRRSNEWYKIISSDIIDIDGNRKLKYYFDNGDTDIGFEKYTPSVEIFNLNYYEEILKRYPTDFPKEFHGFIDDLVYKNDIKEIIRLEKRIEEIKNKYK